MMNHRIKHRKIFKPDAFDAFPDDLVLSILAKLSASASSPADLISFITTCKRMNRLGLNQMVLSQAGPKTLSFKAKNWSASTHRFLFRCAAAGSSEAMYTLGMIRFYCINSRDGLSLMARAAIKCHAPALYSLAVIHFNGSGSASKNLEAGVALAQRAASLGHVHALRELGHCLQDGFGVCQNVAEGRRLLIQADARELASLLRAAALPGMKSLFLRLAHVEAHPVNGFLKEWFSEGLREGLRMCSHGGCGRPETREREFRRCSVCGKVNYCSRGCQALDWKLRHKVQCVPMLRWHHGGDGLELEGLVPT